MKNRRKTSNMLINPGFQLRFMKMLFGLLVVTYVVVLVVANWVYGKILDELLLTDLPIESRALIERASELNIYIAILLFFVLVCFFTVASLLISHKIAGPLHNFETNLEIMGEEKKLKEIKLRKGDFFSSLETKFNHLVSKFNNK